MSFRYSLRLTPENLMAQMQTFPAALGVENQGGCNFCHEADRSLDTKPAKIDCAEQEPKDRLHLLVYTETRETPVYVLGSRICSPPEEPPRQAAAGRIAHPTKNLETVTK